MNKKFTDLVRIALKEDIGKADITTDALIPKNKFMIARIFSKEPAVICGIEVAKQAFYYLDRNAAIKTYHKDGDRVRPQETIMQIKARAGALLSAERVALNFLSFLSGIATETQKFVKGVGPTKAKILDTRKTIPLLRQLEKYAVRCSGAVNHRLGLSDMVLIKDNHKQILKGKRIQDLINLARSKNKGKKIEIEVENLKEFRQALEANPDLIMLDNMPASQIKKALKLLRQNHKKTFIKLEASGNISLKNVLKIAKTGVDFISVGSLTHSPKSVDMSLEIIN